VINNPSDPIAAADRTQLLAWVERIASFCAEQIGVPLITGRILGWLMICDPAEQSGGEIAEAIGASRASITTSIRLLVATELIRPLTIPGERTTYYRIDDDAWEKVIRRRIAGLASFCQITRDGLALVGEEGSRASRIRAAHDIHEWVARVYANAPEPPSNRPKR
jgi:hypothetical protein